MDFARQQRDPTRHLIGIAFVILVHALVIWALADRARPARSIEVIKKPLTRRSSRRSSCRRRRRRPPPPPPKKITSRRRSAAEQPYVPPPDIPRRRGRARR